MAIFAIGDLHLCATGEKPMDVFGSQWDNHFEKISRHWREVVSAEDTVLIPGDISWAMHLPEAKVDLERIDALPGRKVLLRGNHDDWWSSIAKVRECLALTMHALQNDALEVEDAVVCGTRGWTFPLGGKALPDPQEQKIFQRELIRLEMSLQSARKLSQSKPLIAMLHFPPLLTDHQDTEYTFLLERYNVQTVVYGHLHGAAIANAYNGEHNGVHYRLVSCDGLDFSPVAIDVIEI